MRPGNLKSVAGGRYVHRQCGPELGAAKQEFREDADINRIIAKYKRDGVFNDIITGAIRVGRNPILFGDDPGFRSYADAHASLEIVRDAFMKLPPEIRLELGNDPARFHEMRTEEGVRAVIARAHGRKAKRLEEARKLVEEADGPRPPSPAGAGTTPPAGQGVEPPKGGKQE